MNKNIVYLALILNLSIIILHHYDKQHKKFYNFYNLSDIIILGVLLFLYFELKNPILLLPFPLFIYNYYISYLKKNSSDQAWGVMNGLILGILLMLLLFKK